MIYQYSYYKPYLNLKLEFYVSIICFVSWPFQILVFDFLYVPVFFSIFLLSYEFIQCVISGRKLSRLLRQRLYDAIRHENQNKCVILYYKIAHKEFRLCFSIMLVAIFLHLLVISLGLLSDVSLSFSSSVLNYENVYYFTEPIFIGFLPDFIEPMIGPLFTFGSSLQLLTYLIVSFRRIIRSIRNRRIQNRELRFYRSSLKPLIEKNNLAYNKRMRY